MSPKIPIALCGALMVGVAVPVIIAASGNIPALILGIVMLLCGGLLTISVCFQQAKYQWVLLCLNALIATTVLIGSLLSTPHTFLVIWSASVIMLSGISGWLLSSSGAV